MPVPWFIPHYSPPPKRGNCFWHNDEQMPETYWKACTECGHVYETLEDAIKVDREQCERYREDGMSPPPIPRTKDDEWTFCSLCMHDF